MDSNNRTGKDQDKDFPGYPHYPSNEDITNPATGNRKTGIDVEELANSRRLSSMSADNTEKKGPAGDERVEEEDDLGIVSGTEADVTEEDLAMLGDKDADQDMNDDELVQGSARVDFLEEESDLDIPGAELDDESEATGEGDEENDYYSLGGDRHESLDEDPAGGNQDQ